ncbi:hypothetical protein RR46_09250 [Papilio xuthus]|uniref:Uncharacterized protein n=1 Tax=Papilio xuthus TaxID=66420 RepID=A0A194PWG2_PAPXU|nr:hypothetical protein RR46_09250 [Papilio xuthus]
MPGAQRTISAEDRVGRGLAGSRGAWGVDERGKGERVDARLALCWRRQRQWRHGAADPWR